MLTVVVDTRRGACQLIDASGDGVLSAAELTAAVASDAAVKDFVGTQPELAGWLKPSKLKLVLGEWTRTRAVCVFVVLCVYRAATGFSGRPVERMGRW